MCSSTGCFVKGGLLSFSSVSGSSASSPPPIMISDPAAMRFGCRSTPSVTYGMIGLARCGKIGLTLPALLKSFLDRSMWLLDSVFRRQTPQNNLRSPLSEHRAREQEKAPRVTAVGLFYLTDRLCRW